jgi:hypothetical protein
MATEPWYLAMPEKNSENDSNNLCMICRSIDFAWLLYHCLPLGEALPLGHLPGIIKKETHCAFCRLIVQAILIDFDMDFTSLVQTAIDSIECKLGNRNKGHFGDKSCSLFSIIVSFIGTPNGPVLRSKGVVPEIELHRISEAYALHEGRRLHSPDFDSGDIEQWLDSQLKSDSMHTLDTHITASLLFIDVHQRCITKVSTARLPPYTALSYVWGGPQALLTTRATLAYMSCPGSLARDEVKLPQTIWDAMTFTAMIGLRYLWVDSVCIVQDD